MKNYKRADRKGTTSIPRRRFLSISAATIGGIGTLGATPARATPTPAVSVGAPGSSSRPGTQRDRATTARAYGGDYRGDHLNQVAFPMGGMGAGMICLEGTGALSHVSLHHKPSVFNEPLMFAAVSITGSAAVARVLEGPVPARKIFGKPGTGNGGSGAGYGLPRFSQASFQTRFPFGTVALSDPAVQLTVRLTGWSPFEPGDSDHASLPVAALEYEFTNTSANTLDAVFSFNARNFMPVARNAGAVKPASGGFTLWGAPAPESPWEEGSLSVTTSEPGAKTNLAWFRGGWFDALTMAWKDIAEGACVDRPAITEGTPGPGASLFIPFRLAPRETRTIVVRVAWYVGRSNLRVGKDPVAVSASSLADDTYRPWYSGRFASVDEVNDYWRSHYAALRAASRRFADCFYASSLPPEVVEAVAANLTILKSPTVLRQADGRLWGWEGCNDQAGCCAGSCTHVWNYAQALPHLFPALERTLRDTEFGPSQSEEGHQTFRSALPIRLVTHEFHAASDGQLGGIMKAYREWRISGDTKWLRRLWPRIRKSLDYCIATWDPDHNGVLSEPHHNTYDIEFWGPDGMCTSFYVGALEAATQVGRALGDEVPLYAALRQKGSRAMEGELYNGEYFIQRIQWKNLRAKSPLEIKSMVGNYSPEAQALMEKEGPKYQYGNGCLSDGVLGAWLAWACGVSDTLGREKVTSHLRAVHRYNLKHDLSGFANPQRPTYACGAEGGLLLCTWPRGDALSLPFVYSNEVWTGIEYQAASHMIRSGLVNEGLEVVRVCRDRYDGRVRNPFNEYECGHWYARAMSSYALLQALSGARYDAVDKVLHLEPRIKGDFRCFFSTASGYGLVGVKNGKPFFEPASGQLEIREMKYVEA
ncbi:MAG: hypothetical protein IMZ55_01095 [Acidobacteria bacterium]|nr:hypothetical protein [Acidobacteriota bacterium]